MKNYLRKQVSQMEVHKHSYLLNREHYPPASKRVHMDESVVPDWTSKAKTWSTREYVKYGSQRGTVSQGRGLTRHGRCTHTHEHLFNLGTNNGRRRTRSSAFSQGESSFTWYCISREYSVKRVYFTPQISRVNRHVRLAWGSTRYASSSRHAQYM